MGPVSEIIAAFVAQWRTERPSQKGRYGDDAETDDEDLEPMAPYRWLAVETGLAAWFARADGRFWTDAAGRPVGIVSDADIEAAEKKIRRARNMAQNKDGSLRFPTVELRVADAIVQLIGDPGMFLGDEPALKIRPNPKAPKSRHHECCGSAPS